MASSNSSFTNLLSPLEYNLDESSFQLLTETKQESTLDFKLKFNSEFLSLNESSMVEGGITLGNCEDISHWFADENFLDDLLQRLNGKGDEPSSQCIALSEENPLIPSDLIKTEKTDETNSSSSSFNSILQNLESSNGSIKKESAMKSRTTIKRNNTKPKYKFKKPQSTFYVKVEKSSSPLHHQFKCHICGRLEYHQSVHLQHIKGHPWLSCNYPECTFETQSMVDLNEHKARAHRRDQKHGGYRCTVAQNCHNSFLPTIAALNKHVSQHLRPFYCRVDKCPYTAPNMDHVLTHLCGVHFHMSTDTRHLNPTAWNALKVHVGKFDLTASTASNMKNPKNSFTSRF